MYIIPYLNYIHIHFKRHIRKLRIQSPEIEIRSDTRGDSVQRPVHQPQLHIILPGINHLLLQNIFWIAQNALPYYKGISLEINIRNFNSVSDHILELRLAVDQEAYAFAEFPVRKLEIRPTERLGMIRKMFFKESRNIVRSRNRTYDTVIRNIGNAAREKTDIASKKKTRIFNFTPIVLYTI